MGGKYLSICYKKFIMDKYNSSIFYRKGLTSREKCKHCIYLEKVVGSKRAKFCVKQCKMYKFITADRASCCKYFTYKEKHNGSN